MLRSRRKFLATSLLVLMAACGNPAPGGVTSTIPTPTVPNTPATNTPVPTAPLVLPTATAPILATPTPGTTAQPTSASTTPIQPTSTVVAGPDTGNVATVKAVVDQVGYLPAGTKVATFFVADAPDRPVPKTFQIVPVGGGVPVFDGAITGPLNEPESGGHPAWLADFSSLQTDGTYQIQVGGVGVSPTFAVSRMVYADLFAKSVREYFLNRCGVAVDDPQTGVKHAACHRSPAALAENGLTSLDVSGGWHDAGDYGRYVPTGAVTVGQLLLLAEHAPAAAKVDLNGTDLLREARYELDWLLRMQRADGALYHLVSTAKFPGFIRPEADSAPLLVYSVGSADTAGAAAAFARASRAFSADRPYADTLRAAALRAWQWLQANPTHVIPSVGKTGTYLTGDDRDTREWAAAELFALTGDATYEAFLKDRPRTSIGPITWADTSDLALLTHAFNPAADAAVKQQMLGVILSQAKERAAAATSHPYGVVLRPNEYYWASAKFTLSVALHLILANRLQPDPTFITAALNQLHWVLGRNPLGRSFVTGVGALPPLHPHHRLVAATGKMIPGMLVGGPNQRAQDGKAPANLGPRSYLDEQLAYSVNEPAIDYNAPLVFVSGWLAYGQG